MQYNITKIPSLLAGYDIPRLVTVDEHIYPVQGLNVLCQVTITKDRMNALEDTNPVDFTTVSDDDTLPVILGKRHAIRGYSGDVPSKLSPGDSIELLCESEFAGVLQGGNEDYGCPPTLTALGTIPGADGRPLTMKATVPPLPPGNERPKLRREGADPVYAVHDGGISSTCGDVNGVITSAFRVLVAASQSDPDVIVVEFGDGILGGYHVKDVLACEAIQKNMLGLAVSVSDLASAWGVKELLSRISMEVSVFTRVSVNSRSAQRFIEKQMGVLAESNRSDLPRTLELIKSKLDEWQPNL